MQFEQLISELTTRFTDGTFINGTISQPRMKSDDLKRIRLKPIELRGELHIQFEYQYERVLNHENIAIDDLPNKLTTILERFRQVHAEFSNEKNSCSTFQETKSHVEI